MGDAGSIPLGFLLGWLMLDLALHGHWAAALILPLYFVADATFTLLKRAPARREALAGAPRAFLSARGAGRRHAARRGLARRAPPTRC